MTYAEPVVLLIAALVLAWFFLSSFLWSRKENEEDQLKKDVRAWVDALGKDFVAINRGSGWRWVVDPWRPPWDGTKWETFYDEVFDFNRSGD